MLQLFFYPSPNPLKIALFLEECHVPYEIVVANF
jgi:GST-like protein